MVKLNFLSSLTLFLPSFFLLPTTKFCQTHNNHNDHHINLGAAVSWRLLDGNGGLETQMRLESPVCFFSFSFIVLLIFITATLLLWEVPIAATEVDEDTRTQRVNKDTRSQWDSKNQRVNEDTTRDMVSPSGVFFSKFFYSLLNFVLATTITLMTMTTTGSDQTQTPQTCPPTPTHSTCQ